MKQTVYVGLSGGVDSAVSAARLKEAGYTVVGAFIKIWQPEFIECTWKEDRLDAMRVCAALDIPFREIDLSAEYQREVIDRMLADYAQGITPNPDVLCNRAIKFGSFLAWAKQEGADLVATGHYARIGNALTHLELVRAADPAKDQSYFLYTLAQSELRHALFPIGGLTKQEVRAEAKRFSLPVADKPDSQGLCFVGEVSMADFLARFLPVERGAVLDTQGRAIGEHDGAALYTLGQRHGFTVHGKADGPQYVIGIDVGTNTIRVSPHKLDAACTTVALREVSWVHQAPRSGSVLLAQTRYHETPIETHLTLEGDRWHARFAQPHIASPGQSLVVYEKHKSVESCLGGGVIVPIA